MLDQAASTYIKGAYKHIGIDMNKYESHYILNTGAKMLALGSVGNDRKYYSRSYGITSRCGNWTWTQKGRIP